MTWARSSAASVAASARRLMNRSVIVALLASVAVGRATGSAASRWRGIEPRQRSTKRCLLAGREDAEHEAVGSHDHDAAGTAGERAASSPSRSATVGGSPPPGPTGKALAEAAAAAGAAPSCSHSGRAQGRRARPGRARPRAARTRRRARRRAAATLAVGEQHARLRAASRRRSPAPSPRESDDQALGVARRRLHRQLLEPAPQRRNAPRTAARRVAGARRRAARGHHHPSAPHRERDHRLRVRAPFALVAVEQRLAELGRARTAASFQAEVGGVAQAGVQALAGERRHHVRRVAEQERAAPAPAARRAARGRRTPAGGRPARGEARRGAAPAARARSRTTSPFVRRPRPAAAGTRSGSARRRPGGSRAGARGRRGASRSAGRGGRSTVSITSHGSSRLRPRISIPSSRRTALRPPSQPSTIARRDPLLVAARRRSRGDAVAGLLERRSARGAEADLGRGTLGEARRARGG